MTHTLPDSLLRDARFSLRLLKKSPAFTIISILTLALGIGANTAIFSVVHSVLLRSLPFPRPSALVYLSARSTLFDFPYLGLSLLDLSDVRSTATSFSSIAVFQDSPKELSSDGKPQRLECSEVTEDFFPVLGLRPLYGRAFTNADMQPGTRSVILSNALWKDRFAADPAVIGKSIMLDAQPHTIIGVMPAQPPLGFATDSQLFTAFIPTKEQLADRGNHAYSVIARLKPRVSVASAEAELSTISARLSSAYPDVDKDWSIHATSLKQFLLGDAQAPLAILFCAVGFVLLIACANVGNLFLARGWARRREFAIRAAIGATRAALLRQLGVESLIIALAGGVCAFLIALWTTQALRTTLPPDIPRLDQIQISLPVALFTLAASIAAALLAAAAPALLTTRTASPCGAGLYASALSAITKLKSTKSKSVIPSAVREAKNASSISATKENLCHPERSEGSQPSRLVSQLNPLSLDPAQHQTSTPHNHLRQSLVIAEIALAAILLIGATLALRSFSQLLHMDLGFRPDNVLTIRLDFPKFRFATPDQAIVFVQQVLSSVRAIPGVDSASVGLVYPMSDEVAETTFETEATASDPNHAQQSALANRVAPDFFRTLGIPLLAGRDFTGADAKGKSPVFIVNESLAKKYFGTTDVIGKRLSTDFSSGHPVWGQIIGVTGNLHRSDQFDPQGDVRPQVYAPFYQSPRIVGVYLLVRANPLPRTPVSQVGPGSLPRSGGSLDPCLCPQRALSAGPLGVFLPLGLLRSWLPHTEPLHRRVGLGSTLASTLGSTLRSILGLNPDSQSPDHPDSTLSLIPALQDRIWSIDKNQPITSVATINQRIAEVNASPRSQTLLLGIFATLGFLLALIGVYGVMSYLVGLQTREIGIRMALGATPSQVLRRILAHCLKLTTIGILLGLAGGLVLTRFMSSQLFAISPNDPATYAAVALLLLLVSTAASYAPARRASQLNPTTALRHE
ncbi:MAG: ABC transporter permease [Candidatus Acidiferrum sp.]